MPRNATKRPESRCPKCGTAASKTPVGKARKAAMEAQEARQQAQMEAAQRQAMVQRQAQMQSMRPAVRPGMAPPMMSPMAAHVPQRPQIDPRALMAMLAARRGGR